MRRTIRDVCLCVCAVLAMAATAVGGEGRGPSGGRVNNLKVLSDKVDDVTTVENILRSFVRPGMSDEERSLALWTAAVKYRHQTAPPNEFLSADWEAHDPVKIFNVYGYCMCCCCSALVESLNRADGREARGRILNNHSVAEVRYDDAWHMFDTSLIAYFPKAGDGAIASVDEITAAVTGWHAAHPGYRKDGARLFDLMRSEDWTGWKSKGPELLASCPSYDQGYLPARTHGWDATMVEYARKSEVYEYGYQVGHRALFSLRPGESFVREAGNRGLHVNMAAMPDWAMLKARAPDRDLVYLERFLPGYRGGVVGNGTHRYAPDLAHGGLAAGAERYDNLDAGAGTPALRAGEGGGPGVAVIPMISPYVALRGRVRIKAVRPSEADHVRVSLSTDNGRRFTTLWTAPVGTHEVAINLGESILRRYAYWVKLEIVPATPGGSGERAGISALAIETDFQHAPRTLPRLEKGRNSITVSADDERDGRDPVDRLPDHARRFVHQKRDDRHDGRRVRQPRRPRRLVLVEGGPRDDDRPGRGSRRPVDPAPQCPGTRPGSEGHDSRPRQHRSRPVLARARRDPRADARDDPYVPGW